MDEGQRGLWEALGSLQIGDPNAELGFARRLARENAWGMAFAERVIVEYKKFVFLAMEAGHPVTPSDEVDQAWHLHLLYTESYWHDLCRDLLGRPLHHGPTRGGKAEGEKFRDWYGATLGSYRRLFGEEPPADIWPPSERRFGLAPYFRRINIAEHWVVSRRRVRRRAKLAAAGGMVLSLAGCGTVLAQQGGAPAAAVLFVVFIVAIIVLALLGSAKNKRRGRSRKGDDGGNGFFGASGCGFGGCGGDAGSGGDSGCGSGCGGCGGCGG
jgi:hypothetical protein